MSDLLPCPFCGGTDLYFPHGTDPAVIECSGCGTRSGVPDEQTEAEAIAAWNRRAIPATDARADAMREAAAKAYEKLFHRGDWTAAQAVRDSILALITEAKP